MPALARVQVQVQGRGGQGSSDWLVGRWKNTKEREAPTPHQGRASRNTGLEASSVPPVSGTKHSRVDGPGSTFKTHLNLGKPRVLAEPFFKGKKKRRGGRRNHTWRISSEERALFRSCRGNQVGSPGLASVSPHSSGPRPSSWFHPHAHLSCSPALLPSKTPESLINYKHAFWSVCRRQISVLAALFILLVSLIDRTV